MQQELNGLGLALDVVILGVNEVGHESGNDLMTTGRDLPWLQDTALDDVWGTWAPVYRDVVVLDPDNQEIAVFNLTVHDLADPVDYDALKQILIDAATP
jgi:hypothetical protein